MGEVQRRFGRGLVVLLLLRWWRHGALHRGQGGSCVGGDCLRPTDRTAWL